MLQDPDKRLTQPGENKPVDAAHIVAGDVGTVIEKIAALASAADAVRAGERGAGGECG